MNLATAESTSILLLKLNAALDAQLAVLQLESTPAEFAGHRERFGIAMSGLLDILNPLWLEHPSLLPVQMGGAYELPRGTLSESVAQLMQS